MTYLFALTTLVAFTMAYHYRRKSRTQAARIADLEFDMAAVCCSIASDTDRTIAADPNLRGTGERAGYVAAIRMVRDGEA